MGVIIANLTPHVRFTMMIKRQTEQKMRAVLKRQAAAALIGSRFINYCYIYI